MASHSLPSTSLRVPDCHYNKQGKQRIPLGCGDKFIILRRTFFFKLETETAFKKCNLGLTFSPYYVYFLTACNLTEKLKQDLHFLLKIMYAPCPFEFVIRKCDINPFIFMQKIDNIPEKEQISKVLILNLKTILNLIFCSS